MLLLANKPLGISSAAFAAKMGRKYGVKFGFSGTLDPFARGALLLACKKHARLFRFLRTAPKVYSATIWLGAVSPSLDDENLSFVPTRSINETEFRAALDALQGQITYTPPQFCAKKVRGVRAYELARSGKVADLAPCIMDVKSEFIALCGPFASFRLHASRGTYVRSYAQLVCERLGVCGTLASLQREQEGDFKEFKEYEAFSSVALPQAQYLGDVSDILLGKKLQASDFKIIYNDADSVASDCVKVDLGGCFSVLKFTQDNQVKYELNAVEK